MIKKFKKIVQDVKVAIAIGMSNTDKEIMSGNFTKVPESAGVVNPNYSRNSFLRSVQLGQLKEEQLQRYFQVLDAFDHIHTRTRTEWIEVDIDPEVPKSEYRPVYNEDGSVSTTRGLASFAVPMTPEEIEAQDNTKQLIGDPIEGYFTNLFIKNKDILFVDATNLGFDQSVLTEAEKVTWNKTGYVFRPTVIIHRPDGGLKGGVKIEDFCTEVYVKLRDDFKEETDRDAILEFYCVNYNWRQRQFETDNGLFQYDEEGNVVDDFKPNLVYDKVTEGLNLKPFVDLEAVTMKQSTATRNDIIHNYEITSFLEIKNLGKSFVVKFNANKI